MRVLVLGGTKFIGPRVVERLHEDGHAVTVFHRGESESDRLAELMPPHPAAVRNNYAQSIVVDSTRVRAELGYAERVPWDDGIARAIAWERAHPPERVKPEVDRLRGRGCRSARSGADFIRPAESWTAPLTSAAAIESTASARAVWQRGSRSNTGRAGGVVKRRSLVALSCIAVIAAACGGGKTSSGTTTTPTPGALPSVIPSAAASPSPAPAPTAQSSKLTVGGGVIGGSATAVMHTTPGAACAITYFHPSGKTGNDPALAPATAGADGVVTWTWPIGTGTWPPGKGRVSVKCGGEEASAEIDITPLAVYGGVIGGTLIARLYTTPSASCTASYTDPSGSVRAVGTGPKTASPDGVVTWSWSIGQDSATGQAFVETRCGNDQASAPITISPAPPTP